MESPEDTTPDETVQGTEETEEVSSTLVKAGTSYTDDDGEKGRIEASITFDPGADLTAACEAYGEEAVYQRYLRGVTKDLGNAIRSSLNKFLLAEDGPDPSSIPALVEAELKDWRPDVSRRPTSKKDPTEVLLANFDDLPAERQQEIIAQIMERAKQ